MNYTELNTKIVNTLSELHQDIEKYVRENAKFNIGDIVKVRNEDSYNVITKLGFDKDFGIVYYGSKVVKSTGKESYQNMYAGIGVPEYSISKSTLKVGKTEISKIEKSSSFDNKIKIDIR